MTVGWSDLFSFTFIRSCILDGTRPTPRRNAVTSFVVVANGVDSSALAAGLMPFSVNNRAAAVLPLVCKRADKFKVRDVVIEFVFVSMVDLIAFRNRAVDSLSYGCIGRF